MKTRYVFAGTRTLARQRGAIGILGALVLAMGVLFMALSVDSGRLYLEQRRLQKIADLAALDASRALCGAAAADLTAAENLAKTAAQRSAVRNGYGGDLTAEPDAVPVGNTSPDDAGLRQFTGAALESATAVKVTARNRVPSSLVAGGWWGGTTTLSATAVAGDEAIAGFSAGSFLARLDTKNSPILNALLGGILGSNLSLDLASWQGIAATKLNLLNLLAAQTAVGTVDELLAADLTLAKLLSLTATAVSDSGTASVDVKSALGKIISAAVSNLHVHLGDVIGLESPTSDAAAEAQISVLDLITTAALVANGQNAIALPLQVSLLGLTVTANLRVIEPPQIAIGRPGRDENGEWRTQMKTAQIRLDAYIGSRALGLLLIDLNLQLEVAQGSAWLESIDCGGFGKPSKVTVGAQPGIASLRITRSPTDSQPARIRVKLLLLPPVDVNVGLNLPLQPPTSTDLVYTVDHSDTDGDLPRTETATSPLAGSVGNGLERLADKLVLDVNGIPLSEPVKSLVGSVPALIVSQIAGGLLDPVLTLLGIKAGGLDVQLFELKEDRPKLRI